MVETREQCAFENMAQQAESSSMFRSGLISSAVEYGDKNIQLHIRYPVPIGLFTLIIIT